MMKNNNNMNSTRSNTQLIIISVYNIENYLITRDFGINHMFGIRNSKHNDSEEHNITKQNKTKKFKKKKEHG